MWEYYIFRATKIGEFVYHGFVHGNKEDAETWAEYYMNALRPVHGELISKVFERKRDASMR
jgi:hypothetical protein